MSLMYSFHNFQNRRNIYAINFIFIYIFFFNKHEGNAETSPRRDIIRG